MPFVTARMLRWDGITALRSASLPHHDLPEPLSVAGMPDTTNRDARMHHVSRLLPAAQLATCSTPALALEPASAPGEGPGPDCVPRDIDRMSSTRARSRESSRDCCAILLTPSPVSRWRQEQRHDAIAPASARLHEGGSAHAGSATTGVHARTPPRAPTAFARTTPGVATRATPRRCAAARPGNDTARTSADPRQPRSNSAGVCTSGFTTTCPSTVPLVPGLHVESTPSSGRFLGAIRSMCAISRRHSSQVPYCSARAGMPHRRYIARTQSLARSCSTVPVSRGPIESRRVCASG